MAPEVARLVRRFTLALVILSAAAAEVTASEGRLQPGSLGLTVVWACLALGLGWLTPAPKVPAGLPPRGVLLALLALAAAPFLAEPILRSLTDEGHPLEVRMVFSLRNLGLGLAAFAGWLLCLRLACVVSLFLMLFAASLTGGPLLLVLLGLYGAAGSAWLMLVYWGGLRQGLIALDVQPGRERLPWVWILTAVGLVCSTLALAGLGPRRVAQALGEWLPTSGGSDGHDPFARGGVNDGDEEVSGENAHSTGMTPTDSFLDSPLPSLYDMISDLYGEPFKPKEREQAIALSGRGQEGKKKPADNLRPSREFSTRRRLPRTPRHPSDRAARALFEVQGRTPLHVRAASFDSFDGVTWREPGPCGAVALLEKEPGSCWMRVHAGRSGPFAGTEEHSFKVTAPDGSLLPAPPHLSRFRVGRVDRADFFAWGPERILRLARRRTPAGIVVETESRTVEPRLLDGTVLRSRSWGSDSSWTQLPANLSPQVQTLARRWAGDRPTGWPQVAAILERLRGEYVVDRLARPPEGCKDPLAHFLLCDRRGPDYQFATAAAVLPRVLGYHTRLVSGFYVAPEHYDAESDHTPVVREDLHFWAEVLLPAGDWLVVEATPGYEVLRPRVSLAERLGVVLLAGAAWAWHNAVPLSLGLMVLAVAWWRRREGLDALAVACWRCFPGRTWRQCVRRAAWLLERRGAWAGRPRRGSQTFASWLRQAPPSADLERLARLAEWAAYAPEKAGAWSAVEVRSTCRRVLEQLPLRRWRTAGAGSLHGAGQ